MHPNAAAIMELAVKYNEDDTRIRVWFNNRRVRYKRKKEQRNYSRISKGYKMLQPSPHQVQKIAKHQQQPQQMQTVDIMSSLIFLSQSEMQVDLNVPSTFPAQMNSELFEAMRERIFQLQNLIGSMGLPNRPAESFSTPPINSPSNVKVSELVRSIFKTVLRRLEEKCEALAPNGRYQVKNEITLSLIVIKTLLDFFREYEKQGCFSIITFVKKSDLMVSCIRISSDQVATVFGQEAQDVSLKCKNADFFIERIVLSLMSTMPS